MLLVYPFILLHFLILLLLAISLILLLEGVPFSFMLLPLKIFPLTINSVGFD